MSSGKTLLYCAAFEGENADKQYEVCKLLVDRGANIDFKYDDE